MRVSICLILLVLVVQAALAQTTAAPLATSTTPASIALRLQPNLYQADIEVKQAATLTLFCPLRPGVISFTGLVQKTEVSYDHKARTLTITLPAGKFVITIRPL